MKQKNRFSTLLERLLEVAEVKNYVLAARLQYDVSYISKWVSGRMLPSPKTEDHVLRGISECLVADGSEEGVSTLLEDYQVANKGDLVGAIYDNLVAEYMYVREAQRDSGSTIAPKTQFFPKLNMPQFIERMRHPVLRRVKSLEIMALMDLMGMEREYRIQIASFDAGGSQEQWRYPDVHFSMMIDLSGSQGDVIYDTLFLLNMLTMMTRIDFKLYGSRQAFGRAVFAVADEFSISGMLMQGYQCMAVTVSEDPTTSGTLYRSIRSLCNRERLLVREVSMEQMLTGNDYARSLISPNQRLMFGHMTEHFVPDDLFEELVEQLKAEGRSASVTLERLRWAHTLAKRRFQELPVRVIFSESAFADFAVTGEVDFYNIKIFLNPEQRLRYIRGLRELLSRQDRVAVKLVYGALVSDFRYHADQCVFLTDGISYLSLDDSPERDSLRVVNHRDMKQMLDRFFERVWHNDSSVVVSDREAVMEHVDHILQQVQMIAFLADPDGKEM